MQTYDGDSRALPGDVVASLMQRTQARHLNIELSPQQSTLFLARLLPARERLA